MRKILNYIDGKLTPAKSGVFFEKDNPSRGAPYLLVPDSEAADASAAVSAATAAFESWAKTPIAQRAGHLRKMATLIRQKEEALAIAESTDNGKPIALARALDIPRSSLNLEFYADAISQFHGETILTDARAINNVVNAPLGPVVCISPWNLPLYLLTWKIAPALAAGNTVIAKPSEVTPLTAYLLSEIAIEAGLPPGVLNILHGTGPKAAAPLVTDSKVRAVSFTGSTATGRAISQSVAGQFKKVSLEMGGKNPNIIFADADFDKALDHAARAAFSNQGQICLCGSRIFVERPIYAKVKEALVSRAKALRSGDPLDPSTDQGAVVSRVHMEKILSCFEVARSEGGKFLCGGERLKMSGDQAEGFFIAPTLIEGLSADCRTNQEEIFGPVATLIPFDSEQEVLQAANSTRYGLSASLWTRDLNRAYRVANAIDAGVVWINTWMLRDLRTPFGGMKESGVGREGGMYSLRFFTEPKNICMGL